MSPTGAVQIVKLQIRTGHPSISVLSSVRSVQVISDKLCSSLPGGRLELNALILFSNVPQLMVMEKQKREDYYN